VFGNSASEDAQFYEALVDRPQLKYILTPHEGPGAAMAAGYVKASGEPTIVMQAAVVGLVNAIGQMFNAFKEQTRSSSTATAPTRRAAPGATASRRSRTRRASSSRSRSTRGSRARRHDPRDRAPRIQGGVDAALRPDLRLVALRPQRPARAHRVVLQSKVDPRMRVRPNPAEVERAAKLLVEAKMPLMIVGRRGDDAQGAAKAVKLAELLGMPVTQARQIHASFPRSHPLWVGYAAGGRISASTIRRIPTSSSMSAISCSTTARIRSSDAGRSSSTCASIAPAWET
jgi:hypothetical protein